MSPTEEEAHLWLQEARVLAENFEVANSALIQANRKLEQQIAELRIELEAAKAARRAGEDHLRRIFESATEYAIFTFGLDGRITIAFP